jgi:hypothetical protein
MLLYRFLAAIVDTLQAEQTLAPGTGMLWKWSSDGVFM